MSTLYDIKAAAAYLKITPQQVRNLCRNGKIEARKKGNAWLVDEDQLERFYDTSICGIAEDHPTYLKRDKILEGGPIALSFFSGAMGLDIGLEKAGFNVILASEIDNASRKTIIKNKPEIALIGDILEYTSDEIKKISGLKPEDEIDLIVGGPPCQAFSTAGKRKGFTDKRGNVFLTYIDIITSLRPKFAVIENVRGLLSTPLKHRAHKERGEAYPDLSVEELPGGALHHVLGSLRKIGYCVTFNLYNAANFGSPQKRERVVIICSRDRKVVPYLEPTHCEFGDRGLKKWITLRKAIGDLKDIEHTHINFPAKRLKYYKLLQEGQNWRALDEDLQREALGASFNSGGGKTGFLRRLAWDKPSPTLVTHPAMPATDLAHPEEDRPLSIEEYKRIQEFPDNWVIEGSTLEQYKQIGNAVPISLGVAIGKHILKMLSDEKIEQIEDFKYSRYLNTDELSWEREYLNGVEKQRQLELL